MARILITQYGKQGLIKIEGKGTVQNAVALKKAYIKLLENGATDFVLDLGECELLDSTNLGILLGLGLRLKEKGANHIRVIKANPSLKILFQDLGLDRLFIFIESETGHDPSTSS